MARLLRADPAIRANVVAAMERERIQHAADQKLMEELLRREREKRAADVELCSKGSPPDREQSEPNRVSAQNPQVSGFDFGR